MSYSFSISFDKEIYRKWPQELPGLFPIDFVLVLISKSKEMAPGASGIFLVGLLLVLIRNLKEMAPGASKAYVLVIFC